MNSPCRHMDMANEPIVRARCLYCKQVINFRPSAAKITLFTDTEMIFEFFCLQPGCRAYNRQRIMSIEVARGLSNAGVPTTVVHIPLEVIERQHDLALGALITEGEADYVEAQSTVLFNRIVAQELAAYVSTDPPV